MTRSAKPAADLATAGYPASPPDLVTTWSYKTQYVGPQSLGLPTPVGDQVALDTVKGSGTVCVLGESWDTATCGQTAVRQHAQALFVLSDQTQSLTPRGNAAGGGWAAQLTTLIVDADPGQRPNQIVNGTVCDPSQSRNTGLVCRVDAPGSDASGRSITEYTYNHFGEMVTQLSPKARAEGGGTTRYEYYTDAQPSLAGAGSAGGWLKAAIDPAGKFVVFGYDRAGNVARTWDRDATTAARAPGDVVQDIDRYVVTSVANPPSTAYTETLYGCDPTRQPCPSGTPNPLARPWRHLRAARSQVGAVTVYATNANGDVTTIRPPRGVDANDGTYDTTQEVDPAGNPTKITWPSGVSELFNYDAFSRLTSYTDPNQNSIVWNYDPVGRVDRMTRPRGEMAQVVPPGCREATTGDSPIPSGRLVCDSTVVFDSLDQPVAVTDFAGAATRYLFDAAGRMTRTVTPRNDGIRASTITDRLIDPNGNTTSICLPRHFDPAGAGAAICTSSAAHGVHRSYDAADRVRTATNSRSVGQPNPPTTLDYDADGNLVGTTDPNGHRGTITYDLLGRTVGTTLPRADGQSFTTNYTYSPSGDQTGVTRPDGQITSTYFDAAHRPLDVVTGAVSVTTAHPSTPAAQATTVPGGAGNVRTRYVYDRDGHLVGQFSPRAFPVGDQGALTSPDKRHLTRWDVNKNGWTTAAYVPRWATTGTTDVQLGSTQTDQCPTGAAPSAVLQPSHPLPNYGADVGVCITSYGFDAGGRGTVISPPGGTARSVEAIYTDDNLLSVLRTADPSSPSATNKVDTRRFTYDGAGRVVKSMDALDHGSVTEYSSDGLVLRAVGQPTATTTDVTSYGYDADGNVRTVTDPENQVTSQTYTADGYVASFTTAPATVEGNLTEALTTLYRYDAMGNVRYVFSPEEAKKEASQAGTGRPVETRYTHDNLVRETIIPVDSTGASRATSYSYDGSGRLTGEQTVLTHSGGGSTTEGSRSTTYLNTGWPSVETGRNGSTVSWTYDPEGHVATNTYSGNASRNLTASWYLDGLVRTVDNGDYTSLFSYDGSGRITGQRLRADANGDVREDNRYTYSTAGLPATMTSALTSGEWAWDFDVAGRPEAENRPNGDRIEWTFRDNNTTESIDLKHGSSQVATWDYQHDNLKRVIEQTFDSDSAGNGTVVSGAIQYDYDGAGRLTSVDHGTGIDALTWDRDGNRRSYGPASWTYNLDDSIATDSNGPASTWTYDAAGRLTGDGCRTYAFDGFDRVSTTTATGACTGPAGSSSTTYDGLGRQSSVTGANDTSRIHYLGLSNAIGLETNAASDDTVYALSPYRTPKAARLLDSNPATEFLTGDGQGSLTVASDSTGNLVCSSRYDPFGNPLQAQPNSNCSTGSSVSSLGYNGAREDGNSGNLHFGNRTYDPTSATWLTPDALGQTPNGSAGSVGADPLTANRYAYVNGDPVNLWDPTGRSAVSRAQDCDDDLPTVCADRETVETGDGGGRSPTTNTPPPPTPGTGPGGTPVPGPGPGPGAGGRGPGPGPGAGGGGAGTGSGPGSGVGTNGGRVDIRGGSGGSRGGNTELSLFGPSGSGTPNLQSYANFAKQFIPGYDCVVAVDHAGQGNLDVLSWGFCALDTLPLIGAAADIAKPIIRALASSASDVFKSFLRSFDDLFSGNVFDDLLSALKRDDGVIRPPRRASKPTRPASSDGVQETAQHADEAAPQTTLKLPTSQTWGRLDTLDDHFVRHGADFGARSADDYASQASQFFQRSQRQGLPTKIDANGVIRVYDPATNTFGAYNPNGTTATFFTPKTGANYWAKQPGVSPWSP